MTDVNANGVDDLDSVDSVESVTPNEYPEIEAPMLTDKDKQTFEAILAAENVCLLSGFYENTPTGLICFFSREPDGSVKVYPVGVMLTPEMAAKVKDDLGQPLPIL